MMAVKVTHRKKEKNPRQPVKTFPLFPVSKGGGRFAKASP